VEFKVGKAKVEVKCGEIAVEKMVAGTR